MFQFTIGRFYTTRYGHKIQLIARNTQYPGYETVMDAKGWHRYDRSNHSVDAGRVTGTSHHNPHWGNIRPLQDYDHVHESTQQAQ